MHINASFVTYHVTECFQRRSSSCRICHICSAMQILQICLFPVGYDILRQCIITPLKRAHDTLIQNIVSTSYYFIASNSKTFIESSSSSNVEVDRSFSLSENMKMKCQGLLKHSSNVERYCSL